MYVDITPTTTTLTTFQKRIRQSPLPISSEISLASASTVRAHFGRIFKATTECRMRNVSLVGVLYAYTKRLTMALV